MNADFRTNFSPNDDDADEPRFGKLQTPEERMKMLEDLGYSGKKWHEKEPKSYLGTVIYGALVSCLAAGVLLILSFL
jgi:hypothetical protein